MRSIARAAVPTCVLSAVMGVVMSVTTFASANPAFPAALEKYIPMPCKPHCTICHNTDEGGAGTTKDNSLGKEWPKMFGLDGFDDTSIDEQLIQGIASAGLDADVDHDGVSDLDELKLGNDPDNPSPTAPSICVAASIEYGCVRVARQGPVDSVATAAFALLALIGVSALRRRRRL
jgi:hypothetical protein